MRLLLAAGGSAGHVNPALAIADKALEIFPDGAVLFAGTATGLESKLVPRAGYEFAAIKAAGFQRKISLRNIGKNAKAAYYLVTAENAAKKMIADFKPDAVVGTGGYVTAPVLRAAAKCGVPTVTHESNVLPGLATKMLAKTAARVFLPSEDTLKYFPGAKANPQKYIVVGNPLRGEYSREKSGSRVEARLALGIRPGAFTILSFGGSLGANRITEAVADLLKWERAQSGDFNHIHAYGGNGREIFEKLLSANGISPQKGAHVFTEYIHNMYTCLTAADLVICRAGSMTQTELKAFGRASIQIPWSGAAENHQYYNALSMQKSGAAVLIGDDEISGAALVKAVSALYGDKLRLRLMEENAARMATPDAAGRIISEIIGICRG